MRRPGRVVSSALPAFAVLAGLLPGAPRALGAPPAPPADAPQRLVARALGATPLAADVAELCDRIGGRPTGTDPNERSVSWAAARLRAAGADAVRLEPFDTAPFWLPGPASARSLAPAEFPVQLASCPGAPATAVSGLEAPVVVLESALALFGR